MNMNFYLNTKLITGKNCVRDNSAEFKKLGDRCLIVTGKNSAEKCGALGDVIYALEKEKISYVIYNEICQNPTARVCLEGGRIAKETGARFVVGIGGGSPLDAAKACAAAAAAENPDEDYLYRAKWEKAPLKIVAVGTTAGTGSEVTGVAVLTDSNGRKRSFRTESTFPVLSLGDWRYTEFMSDRLTRSTAVDALSHSLESYLNKTANDITKCFASAGIAEALPVLDKISYGGTETLSGEDREKLYNASLYGGLAISVTGTAFPHALGYFLTENYGVEHGTACGVFLNEFIDYNLKSAAAECEKLFKSAGTDAVQLKRIISAVLPEINVKLTKEDVKELSPRWENNRGLNKTFGTPGVEFVNSMLERLF